MSRGGHSYYSRANRETTVPGGNGCSDREGTTLQQRRQHFKSLLPLFLYPAFPSPPEPENGALVINSAGFQARDRSGAEGCTAAREDDFFTKSFSASRTATALFVCSPDRCGIRLLPETCRQKEKKNERAESRLLPSSKPNRFAKRQAQRTCVFFPSELAKRTESKNRSRNRR